jgi:methylphosphotriester-DNA--protein-cysteine methyltransferase
VKTYTLLGRDGRPYQSSSPGTLGGHRPTKVYGRLDCPTALRWIAKGPYVQNRVFFADEDVAIAAGYRPCGHCLRPKYREWRAASEAQAGVAHAGVARVGLEPPTDG